MKYDTRTDAWRSLVCFFFAAHIPANDASFAKMCFFAKIGHFFREKGILDNRHVFSLNVWAFLIKKNDSTCCVKFPSVLLTQVSRPSEKCCYLVCFVKRARKTCCKYMVGFLPPSLLVFETVRSESDWVLAVLWQSKFSRFQKPRCLLVFWPMISEENWFNF